LTGATFNGAGTLIVTESLSGAGTIGVDVRNDGTLRPGASAGLLSIGGEYTQTGMLDVEIGGTASDASDIQLGLPALSAGWAYRASRIPGPGAGDSTGFIRAVIGD
jgi:hypothetical protein